MQLQILHLGEKMKYTVQWGHHNAEREKKRKTEPKEQTIPKTHTHTLAQKYLIELLMWNVSYVQKTLQ